MENDAEALMSTAKAANKKGDYGATIAAYTAADALYAAADDERGRVRCWSGIAKAHGKKEDFPQSARAFGAMAAHAAAAGWAEKEIEALYNQGLLLQEMGTKGAHMAQVEQAISVFEQALAVAERTGDRVSVGVLYIVTGLACAWSNRFNGAIRYLAAAASFALDGADFDTAYSVLSTLGTILSNRGRGAEAIPYYERALELAKSPEGSIVAVAESYANLGIAYDKAGQLAAAIEAMETYAEILKVAGDTKAPDADAMVRRLKSRARNT